HRFRQRELIDVAHAQSSSQDRPAAPLPFSHGRHVWRGARPPASLDRSVDRPLLCDKRKKLRLTKTLGGPMRIGKQDAAFTAIATSDEHSITVRGHDLCADLIGQIDLTDYLWLLVTGKRATKLQRDISNACMVAIAEHGLVPSVQAARMTLAAAPEAWQGAMSAGLLGMGSVVAGSSEIAARYVVEVLDEAERTGSLEKAARSSLEGLKAKRAKVPGLGHPQHSAGDPRANKLLELSDNLGVSGKHVECLRMLGKLAPEIMGRPLPINVS